MDPRLPRGSTSQVFLTETHSTVQVPVPSTQHSLDDNPEFADFLHRQKDAVIKLHSTGLTPSTSLHLPQSIEVTTRRAHARDSILSQEQAREAAFLQRLADWQEAKEADKEQTKAKLERHWHQMMAKITFPEPEKDYYKQTPLKPGLWFWKYLLTNKKVPVNRLKLWIPEVLAIFDDLRWAYTDPVRGTIVSRDDFNVGILYKAFEKYKNGNLPCSVMRLPGETVYESKAVLLSWFDLGEKVLKGQLPTTGIIQTLIKCHGARPTIIRLFYIPQSKSNRGSYAYSISNTDSAMTNYYAGKYVVCPEYHDGVEITPQHGAALNAVKQAAARLVDYLQLAYLVRFEEIVLDFIRDHENRVWLLSCKGFRIDMAVQRLKELRSEAETGLESEEIKEFRETQREEQLSAVHCTLCRLPYKSIEMTHVLPYKVLLIYKQHTYRSERKRLDLSHIKVTSPDFLSHLVSVCEICYMLLVHEYELLETEMKLASLLNVPVTTPQLSGTFEYDQPNYMPEEMHQWRVLLYFQVLETENPFLHRQKLYLQYHFLDAFYIYEIKLKWPSPSYTPLHIARLYYFFAQKTPQIVYFCQSNTLHFRLTKTKNWADVLAVGDCKPLSHFNTQLPDSFSVVQSIDLLLFQDAYETARVRMKAGLACDKALRVKDLPVTITKYENVYIPEASYFTSDSIPDSWMETFEEGYQGVRMSNIEDSSNELDQIYTPVIGPKAVPHFDSPNSLQRSKSLRISTLESLRSAQKSTEPSTKRAGFVSENTSASSRVVYQLDSVSGLKSPTFLSSRQMNTTRSLKTYENTRKILGNPFLLEKEREESQKDPSDTEELTDIIKDLTSKPKKKRPLTALSTSKSTKSLSYANPLLLQAQNDLQAAKSARQHATESTLRRTIKDLKPLLAGSKGIFD